MGKIYRVTVNGTGQLNGPVRIYKVIDFDDHLAANRMTGSKRYEVLAEWVKVHYPGVKVNPKSLGTNLQVIETSEKKQKKGSTKNNKNLIPTEFSEKGSSIKSVLTGMAIGAISNAFNDSYNNNDDDDDDEIDENDETEMEDKVSEKRNRKETLKKAYSICDFEYSSNTDEIANKLSELLSSLTDLNSVKNDDKSKVAYKKLINKYELGLLRLGSCGDTLSQKFFKKKLRKIKIGRVFNWLFNS